LFPHLGVGERKQMIAYIFILAIITNEGKFVVDAGEVMVCPDRAQFEREMTSKMASGEIKGWTAACIGVNKNEMMGIPS